MHRLFATIRRHPVVTVISVLLALIGVAGVPEDAKTWAGWLGIGAAWLGSDMSRWIAFATFVGLTVGYFVVPEVRQRWKKPPEVKFTTTALREIGGRIGKIPSRYNLDHSGLRTDAATLAGKLMLDAIQHGLFSEDRFAELRHKVDMAQRKQFSYQRSQPADISPPLPWHVFVTVTRWLKAERGDEHEGFSKKQVIEGCDLISKEIDRKLSAPWAHHREKKRISKRFESTKARRALCRTLRERIPVLEGLKERVDKATRDQANLNETRNVVRTILELTAMELRETVWEDEFGFSTVTGVWRALNPSLCESLIATATTGPMLDSSFNDIRKAIDVALDRLQSIIKNIDDSSD